jgi:hypothetical protein
VGRRWIAVWAALVGTACEARRVPMADGDRSDAFLTDGGRADASERGGDAARGDAPGRPPDDGGRPVDARVVAGDAGCALPSPAGCRTDEGCPPGERCSFDARDGCAPSDCRCAAGRWECTPDCGGGVCVPRNTACPGPDPAGCAERGCGLGQVCDPHAGGCLPTACDCDPADGVWRCSGDCGGGACVPEDRPCRADADCSEGREWCEQGVCTYCHDPQVCDLECPPGQRRPIRNGCHPCECRPYVLKWFESCGDPACPGHEARPGIPPCAAERVGEPCATEGARCDPGDPCNRALVCRETDPRAEGECAPN